jgi:hypothetical protein
MLLELTHVSFTTEPQLTANFSTFCRKISFATSASAPVIDAGNGVCSSTAILNECPLTAYAEMSRQAQDFDDSTVQVREAVNYPMCARLIFFL